MEQDQNQHTDQTLPAEHPQIQAQPKTNLKVDQFKLDMLMQKYQNEQNLSIAVISGFFAALLGAFVWALITYFTGFQIGWMAVGVGFLVGYVIKTFGKGIDLSFGITGGVLSLFGCIIGNILTVCIVIANQEAMGVMETISKLDFAISIELLIDTFSPFDVLFYGLAVYYGYKYSFHTLSEEELQSVMRPV